MTDLQLYRALGQSVARRRKDLGLTQAAIAEQIGLTRASLANIETGRQKVLLHQVYNLVEALKLESITELVPATFTVDRRSSKPLAFNGGSVTAAQKAQLEQMIRLALAEAGAKAKR